MKLTSDGWTALGIDRITPPGFAPYEEYFEDSPPYFRAVLKIGYSASEILADFEKWKKSRASVEPQITEAMIKGALRAMALTDCETSEGAEVARRIYCAMEAARLRPGEDSFIDKVLHLDPQGKT